MNEDIRKPEYLRWFPCMDPWVGPKYGCDERRLAVVAESHYLPPEVTRLNDNCNRKRWYAARQECVPDNARLYMNTRKCVERRYESCNPTYLTIDKVVSFEEIAFFNYVFRPAEEGKGGYSGKHFNIYAEDREVSSKIMEWFIWMYRPTAIVIASTIVIKWTCVRCDLDAHPKIDTCMTDHPSYWTNQNTNPFSKDVREFLDKLKGRAQPDQAIHCGARANENLCLH